jgi:hypothetical protein
LITLIAFGEQYTPHSCILCILQCPVTLSLVGPSAFCFLATPV